MDRRLHKTLTVDIMEINGRMVLEGIVRIPYVSAGGILLKADRCEDYKGCDI